MKLTITTSPNRIRVETAGFVDEFLSEFYGIRGILFHVISGVIVADVLAKLLGGQTESLRQIVEIVILKYEIS